MRLSESSAAYLDGEDFTSNFVFDLHGIGHAQPAAQRSDYLRSLVRGKDILDVGFVGHLPLIDMERERGNWLHDILRDSANYCAGIDIDREGCAYLTGLGFSDIFCADIVKEDLPAPLRNRHFDLVVLGETLEHVDDPVAFLTGVHERLAGIADRLVLTTPNAFRMQNTITTMRGHELINSDHRYWFSPYTLAKVMWGAGFREIDISTVWAEQPKRTVKGFIKKTVGRAFPAMRDTLVAESRFERTSY